MRQGGRGFLTSRFAAWNFGGKTCRVCGFPGAGLYREVCKCCWGSLLYCGKCGRIDCYGSPSTSADWSNIAESLRGGIR